MTIFPFTLGQNTYLSSSRKQINLPRQLQCSQPSRMLTSKQTRRHIDRAPLSMTQPRRNWINRWTWHHLTLTREHFLFWQGLQQLAFFKESNRCFATTGNEKSELICVGEDEETRSLFNIIKLKLTLDITFYRKRSGSSQELNLRVVFWNSTPMIKETKTRINKWNRK